MRLRLGPVPFFALHSKKVIFPRPLPAYYSLADLLLAPRLRTSRGK